MTDRIAVGRVGKPHGIRGESTVLPESDDPERFARGSRLFTEDGRELVVRSAKPYRDRGLIVHFEGVRSRAEAEALRGHALTIDPDTRRTLGHGEYWPDDLAGLDAVAPGGQTLGIVDRVEFGPGQDRLVVLTSDGTEVLVPFVDEFVEDPQDGRIVIDAPQGLFPEPPTP